MVKGLIHISLSFIDEFHEYYTLEPHYNTDFWGHVVLDMVILANNSSFAGFVNLTNKVCSVLLQQLQQVTWQVQAHWQKFRAKGQDIGGS